MRFLSSLKPSFYLMVFFTVLLGIIYPLFMWGIGQLLFHREAEGSLYYYKDGTPLGSALIAQNFTSSQYFHPRPSSAGNGFDAANSSASNLGPTSQKLIDSLKQRASDYRAENNLPQKFVIPADAVTASGSGLDPHISIANAQLQAPRVATARNLPLKTVQRIIDDFTEGRTLGIFGQERVNVLALNLELDKMAATPRSP